MRNKFLFMLQEICKKMYKDETIKVTDHAGGYAIPEKGKTFCSLLLQLLFEREYISEPTKIMLRTGKSYREVARSMEGVNENTVKSKIYQDMCKLKRKLGEDVFDKVVDRGGDLERECSILKNLLEQSKKESLTEGFVIKLPPCPKDLEVKQLDEMEMLQLRYLITNYSKRSIKEVEKRMKPQYVAYIKYLEENVKNLDHHEEAIYRCMKAWLKEDGERQISDIVCKADFEEKKWNK